eukprot:6206766-Pleurochrysis_carterae.AAC.1
MALQANLILYRDLPRVLTIRVGWEVTISIGYQRSLAKERAQARGLSAPTGRLKERVAHRQRHPSQAGISNKSLRSVVRALRKYTCDARPKWETALVTVRLR